MPTINEHLSELISAGYRLLYLHTAEEERALGIIQNIATAAFRQLYTYSPASGFSDGESPFWETLDAAPTGSLFVLLDAHLMLDIDPLLGRRLRDRKAFLAHQNITLLMISPLAILPAELEHEVYLTPLPLPTLQELKQMLGDAAPEDIDDAFIDTCAGQARGLTEQEARRAFGLAVQRQARSQEDALQALYEEKKQILKRARGVEVVDNDLTMDDVGGLDQVKTWLDQRREAYGEQARKFGLPTPKGLLLLGVQGCGKSLTAKGIAGQWQFPLLRLDVASLMASAVPAEELLRRALNTCEALAPVVLWLDEIEKGFAGSGGGDDTATRLLGYFLSWLQEHTAPVFTVATANNINLLPPEFVRRGRFDDLFFVDLPTERERLDILKLHIARRDRNPDQFELARFAETARNFSGAELEQVVVAGLYRAFAEKRDLSDDDLKREIEFTVPLYRTQEEAIKKLREWAELRTRPASQDASLLTYFSST